MITTNAKVLRANSYADFMYTMLKSLQQGSSSSSKLSPIYLLSVQVQLTSACYFHVHSEGICLENWHCQQSCHQCCQCHHHCNAVRVHTHRDKLFIKNDILEQLIQCRHDSNLFYSEKPLQGQSSWSCSMICSIDQLPPSAFYCILMPSGLPLQRKYGSIASNIAIDSPYTNVQILTLYNKLVNAPFLYKNATVSSIYIFFLMQCNYGSVVTNIVFSIISISSICYAIHM